MKKCFAMMSLLLLSVMVYSQQKVNVKEQMKLALEQYEQMLKSHPDTTKTPQSFANGQYVDMPVEWWCSGFFGGSLWFLYEYTHDKKWRDAANLWTMAVQREQYDTTTHDLGFMLYCPFGNGYKLTSDPRYKKILIRGAKSLSSRFDPKVGLIKSWDSFNGYKYPVIIDNMMNLEYLFWAAKTTGNKKYYSICTKHADATIKNHFRKDFSTYHVVCYDSIGKVLAQKTKQGFNDTSAWARGQAWALYGYTVMYRETKDRKYLLQASHIADFFIHHPNLPADKIPYWDFNAPDIPNAERDASAGAIACSGLLELSKYVSKEKAKEYFQTAETMLATLSSKQFRSELSENGNFLLKHSVGHKPGNREVDVPLVYADYYFLEALLRYDKVKKAAAK